MKIGRKGFTYVSGVLFIGLMSFLVFQWKDGRSEPAPPGLQVQAGEEMITAKQGGYCWNERGKAVCADAQDPSEDLDEEQVLSIGSGGNAELKFDSPPEAMEMEMKREGGEWEKQAVTDLQLKLPERKGNYVYRIAGQWNQGDVSYAFQVKTE